MEVHHHAHHEGKKSWKSYFWEFLMLFLAVFCGFLAEYQLEHKIEREKAEKYIHDLGENLKYDTLRLHNNIGRNEAIGRKLDTLRATVKEAMAGHVNGNRLYQLWMNCRDFNQVVFNKAAITQLKNSGSLRLIKDDSLVASIIDYYDRVAYSAEDAERRVSSGMIRLQEIYNRFFDFSPFDEMIRKEVTWNQSVSDSAINGNKNILNTDPPLQLLNTDPKELQQLYNEVATFELQLKQYNSYLRWAKGTAEVLMRKID